MATPAANNNSAEWADYWNKLNRWNSYQGNTNWTNPKAGAGPMPTPPKTSSVAAPPVTTPTTPTTPAGPTTPVKTPAQLRNEAIIRANTAGNTWLTTHIKDLGLTNPQDIADITARFNEAMKSIATTIPGGAESTPKIPSFYNYEDLLNKAVTAETGQQRNTLSGQFKALTPQGWESNYFQDTADDPILQSILGQQAGTVRDTLDRKLARGQMTQSAYNAAISQLGYNPGSTDYSGLASSAYSTLQGIGGGVLGGYKEGLGDMGENFANSITNFSLGDIIDPNKFQTDVTNKVGSYTSGMEGDIMKALGSTQLFDPNALFASAGKAAGPSNAPIASGNPQGTGAIQPTEDPRTVGSAGPF